MIGLISKYGIFIVDFVNKCLIDGIDCCIVVLEVVGFRFRFILMIIFVMVLGVVLFLLVVGVGVNL